MTLDITSAVIISFVALICTIMYNNRNAKKQDIVEAQERARRDERVDGKLDKIFDAIGNLQNMIAEMQNKVNEQSTDIKRLEHKHNVLEKRITEIETVLDLKVVRGDTTDVE